MLQPFTTFDQVQKYLYELAADVKVLKFNVEQDYTAKQSELMKLLGDPQLQLRVIHIAGTSGKGSTATILSDILVSQRFKVGSCFSPHIIDICERVQINGKPISRDLFLNYFNQILPALNQRITDNQPPSYFETLTALQLYIFAKENVDYAILEVGLGGRLDASNIPVPNKLCIINQIGLDHMEILGDTLTKIATEKAGIIQAQNLVIALSQSQEVNNVFVNRAREIQADLDFVIPGFCFENVKQYDGKTYFSYIDQDLLDRQIALGMLGNYQAANASLALRATEILADHDTWAIDWSRLKHQLQTTKMIGRFEVVQIKTLGFDEAEKVELHNQPDGILGSNIFGNENNPTKNKTLILDGAHNPQKMKAFLLSLVEYYPECKFDMLLSFKKGKDVNQMLDQVLVYRYRINSIILTSFEGSQDSQIQSQELDQVQQYLLGNDFQNVQIVVDICQAYQLILENMIKSKHICNIETFYN